MKPALSIAVLVIAPALSGLSLAPAQATGDADVGLVPGAGSYPSYLTVDGDYLYFRANSAVGGNDVELYRYDGTTAELLGDISPGPTGSNPSYLTFWNGKLYFSASGPTGKIQLWVYDGTGVSLAPGSESQASLPEELTVYQGNLYFRATRYGGYPGLPNIGTELWKFDGVTQTPMDLYPGTGNSYPNQFIEWRGKLWFRAGAVNDGSELFSYDGVTAGLAVNIDADPYEGASPEEFVVFNDKLYFRARADDYGNELWGYDGTTVRRRTDIFPGAESSNPYGMTVYDGAIYFGAEDGVNGCELWSYVGGVATLVENINKNAPLPGVDPVHHSWPSHFTVCDDLLYFSADDGVHGRELWVYDGTEARMVEDLCPGPYGSEPQELTVYRNSLYFVAYPGELSTAKDLWRAGRLADVAFRRGDSNLDGDLDVSDPIAVLLYLFAGSASLSCEKGGDWDDNGALDLSDAVSLLQTLFLGAPPPAGSTGECALDLTADTLTCVSYPGCE